ncbi:Thioredoxin reductase [Andreprevotia sp. IGB-42]|uniref:NAD(P)/FAD-dependent oxidoreductase n=1 Tax=Andreprevotia sp. IGB-42 TaxID=2497473 RepID=UPI001356B48D|nr:NAD(P)/FAD-dependent oxidoreductase [Andreprevotia sp. IGB-42]KAF0812146.1 Thioredoxin reductase [Andreprevotia sp. IGB-42]
MQYDVAIIGGSYAGLSAGLQLARARQSVLVLDTGARRNRFAQHSHGFLTQDGADPAAIAATARAQLRAYGTVSWLDARAERASVVEGGFLLSAQQVPAILARKLILATGVIDQLPEVPGLAERWGRSVFHCPYCHGYELQQKPLGVLASSPLSLHHALMLPDWGPTTLFLNGAFTPDDAQLQQLQQRGVAIEDGLIREISGERAVMVMQDGRSIALEGLFTLTRTRVASDIAAQLGCEFEAGPTGDFIKTDATRETSVPGVFACGDAARAAGSLALAVGDGVMAGTAAHRALIFGQA